MFYVLVVANSLYATGAGFTGILDVKFASEETATKNIDFLKTRIAYGVEPLPLSGIRYTEAAGDGDVDTYEPNGDTITVPSKAYSVCAIKMSAVKAA